MRTNHETKNYGRNCAADVATSRQHTITKIAGGLVSGETKVYTFSSGRELSKVAEEGAPRYGKYL